MTAKPSVCILYGLAEGPRSGKLLQGKLQKIGISVIDDPRKADIIIAHSGGCFLVPDKIQAKLVMLIGVPYWPHKPLLVSLIQKNFHKAYRSFQTHQIAPWLLQLFWHFCYLFNVRSLAALWRGRRSETVWQLHKPLVIRNADDPFCTPDVDDLPFLHSKTAVRMPGQHDDCWDNPEPYITLMMDYYG